MKFKNYKNPHTNDNRIYSHSDIYNMPLGEVFKRKDELLAQYRVLGAPKESELKNSENVVHVEAYTRSDGTEVKAHWRSKPGGGSSSGQAADINNKDNTQEKTQESKEKTSQKEENEKLYPEEIAGVKRGEPMSFEEAGGENVNPNLYDESGKYYRNCSSCVVAYAARRAGFDVEAVPFEEGGKVDELSYNIYDAWMNSDNKPCNGIEIDVKNGIDCYDYLDETVQQSESYILVNEWEEYRENEHKNSGHVRIIEKDSQGNIIMYDPQTSVIKSGEELIGYIDKWMGKDTKMNPKILRIDDKRFNPYYINDVVRPKKKHSY